MSRRCHDWPQRAAAWLLYAALLATFVTAAINPTFYSILANLYQAFSGPYGSFFVAALVTSFYLSSAGRYGGVLFGLQNITAHFICPAPLIVSAAFLLLNNNNSSRSCAVAQQHLPFLLFSMSFGFRFASSRPTSDLMPFSRWFARASEYLVLIRFWRARATPAAAIWTALRFICLFTILSVGRSHELLRIWQRHHAKRACDAHQARRRFCTLDRILIRRLMAIAWPLNVGATASPASQSTRKSPPNLESDAATPPPPSNTSSSESISISSPASIHMTPARQYRSDHREWLQGHLLSTGLYQHLLGRPEQFTFFWTQGSGLLVLSGTTILLLSAVDVSRQLILAPEVASSGSRCREDPMAWLIAVYSGISFVYVLVQSFPALLARIVEADEDAKVGCSAASAESGPEQSPEGSSSSSSSQHPSIAAALTPACEIDQSASGGDDSAGPTVTTTTNEEEERYTDKVLQEHLLELLKELFNGTALDEIPEMRDASIGHIWRFTTPTSIRALECYECIPYVVCFALVQLTARRLLVTSMAACMRSMRLNGGSLSTRGVLLRGATERVLEKVVPAMIPAAIKLSATDIWRTNKTIVEAEMGLHHINADVADGESRVVKDFRSLFASPAAIDVIDDMDRDGDLDDSHPRSEGRDMMMRASITVFDFAFSHTDGILQMSPAPDSVERDPTTAGSTKRNLVQHMDHLKSFRKLLLLLRMFYIAPYRANLLLVEIDDTHGEEQVDVGAGLRRQCQDYGHGAVLRNLEVMLGGEDYYYYYYWNLFNCSSNDRRDEGGNGGGSSVSGEEEAATRAERWREASANGVVVVVKAWFLLELLLLCLVAPPSQNAPQVETLAAECIYEWVRERKKRLLAMHCGSGVAASARMGEYTAMMPSSCLSLA